MVKRFYTLGLSALTGERYCLVSCGRQRIRRVLDGVFQDLQARGLAHPLLVISDGAGGLKKAIVQCFLLADLGRCIFHKMRNLMNKLSKDKTITDPINARLKACVLRSGSANGSEVGPGRYRRLWVAVSVVDQML